MCDGGVKKKHKKVSRLKSFVSAHVRDVCVQSAKRLINLEFIRPPTKHTINQVLLCMCRLMKFYRV